MSNSSISTPLTLRDLDEIDVDRLRGVGDKKKAALEHFGINSVLDLLETYPRRGLIARIKRIWAILNLVLTLWSLFVLCL